MPRESVSRRRHVYYCGKYHDVKKLAVGSFVGAFVARRVTGVGSCVIKGADWVIFFLLGFENDLKHENAACLCLLSI